MAIAFIVAILALVAYLLLAHRYGAVLCLLTVFPIIISLLYEALGIEGLNVITQYVLLLAVVILNINKVVHNLTNIWKHPLSILFYILIFVIFLHNYYIVGGALNNEDIATFQLNIFLRMVIPYVILLILAKERNILDDFCHSMPMWGAVFMAVFLVLIGIDNVDVSDRLTLQEETGVDSISLSRFGAIILLSAFLNAISDKGRLKYIYFAIALGGLFILILAGQRGVIIGVVAAILAALVFIRMKKTQKKRLWVVVIGIGIAVIALLSTAEFEILHRFKGNIIEQQQYGRIADYGIAWNVFQQCGIVKGLGSMGYMEYTNGTRPYPHSLLLELMAEYGIVGLIYALSLIIGGSIMALKIMGRKNINLYDMDIALIWIALLFSVLVSGSFLTNSIFIIISGALILVYQRKGLKKFAIYRKKHEDRTKQ